MKKSFSPFLFIFSLSKHKMSRRLEKLKFWVAKRNSSLFIIFSFFSLPLSYEWELGLSLPPPAADGRLCPPRRRRRYLPRSLPVNTYRTLSLVSLTLISFSICLNRWWKEAQELSLEAAADRTEGIRYVAVIAASSSTSVESDLVFELRRDGGRDSKRPAAEDEGGSCRCYALIRRDMCSMAVRWWASPRNVAGYLDFCRVIAASFSHQSQQVYLDTLWCICFLNA